VTNKHLREQIKLSVSPKPNRNRLREDITYLAILLPEEIIRTATANDFIKTSDLGKLQHNNSIKSSKNRSQTLGTPYSWL
jgi:hypothetical protein